MKNTKKLFVIFCFLGFSLESLEMMRNEDANNEPFSQVQGLDNHGQVLLLLFKMELIMQNKMKFLLFQKM